MMSQKEHARARLLFDELRWLMRLRWAAAGAIVAASLVDRWAMRWTGHASELLMLGVAVGGLNALFHLAERWDPRLQSRWHPVLVFATLQIYADLACLTLLVLWTGGVHSPAMGFFVFHMIFASMFQPRPRAYLASAFSVLLVSMTLYLDGLWPSTRQAAMLFAGWVCMLWISVFLTEHVTRKMYRRELANIREVRRTRTLSARLRDQQAVLAQQEKLAAVGQLAAGVAHEIANPLANMDSVLQLMQRRPEQPRPDAIANLREQIQRITRTVRQLTSFAHPGKGRYELLALNDVVRAAMDLVQFDRRLRAARLDLQLSDDVGSTVVNRHALEQVITNLVRNALDAMETTREPLLRVRTSVENGTCVIEIGDNGCGVPAENLGRIFEPFYTTKPIGKGTGLGLSISRRLVLDHGGKLEVASRPEVGTTFRIELPRCIPANAGVVGAEDASVSSS